MCVMTTIFDRLLELAADQHGLVTTKGARGVDIDPAQLRLLASRGRLEHVSHGVYRVSAFPVDDLLPYAEAVAWSGGRGVVSHESALAMRGIGDFNPSRIDVTLPGDYFPRRQIPRTLRLHRERLLPANIETVDGVATVTVYTALKQVITDGSDPYHVRRAVADAYKAGHIAAREANRLRQAIARQAR